MAPIGTQYIRVPECSKRQTFFLKDLNFLALRLKECWNWNYVILEKEVGFVGTMTINYKLGSLRNFGSLQFFELILPTMSYIDSPPVTVLYAIFENLKYHPDCNKYCVYKLLLLRLQDIYASTKECICIQGSND